MNKLQGIVIHWNAGQNTPNADDFEHYHYMYGNNKVYNGKHTPEDNINCQDGDYAAHTGGHNTNWIGVALCGMLGFNTITKATKFPISKQTCELMFLEVAKLCKKYNIPIDSNHIMTHYEVGVKVSKGIIPKNSLTSANIGKIDIVYLHAYPEISKDKMGDFIRNKIKAYFNNLK